MMAYPLGNLRVWFCVWLLYSVRHTEATDCRVPDEVDNATLEDEIGTSETFVEGTVLKYDCNIGYRSSVSKNRICQNGRWITPFECTRINCGYIGHPNKGRRVGDSYFVGDRLSFRCNNGYDLSGERTMLCRASGEWRPKTPPTCTPVKCHDNIEYVPNGDSFQEAPDGIRNIFRRVVEFSCDQGYDLIGSRTRTCQADGTWSGTQPVCTLPSCPDFKDLTNGVIYYQDEDINKVTHIATIVCNENFDLFPDIPDGFNTCIEKNQWEYSNFTCEERLEVRPSSNMQLYWITKRNRRRPIRSPKVLKSRTRLTSQCYRGYEMYNSVTRVYLGTRKQNFRVIDGELKPPMAKCKEARCELQECSCTYTDENNNILTGKVEHGTKVTKSCNSRQEFEPVRQRTLQGITHGCDKGVLARFPRCIDKRSEIPDNRFAYLNQRTMKAGDLVQHGETVHLTCRRTEELYYTDDKTYLDIPRFESTSNYGTWTNPRFPVCQNKRCLVPHYDGTSFFTLDNTLIDQNKKVEHGIELEKRCDDNYEDLNKERVTCDRGSLRGASQCTPKRSKIPNERSAYLNGRWLDGGSFVDHDKKVYIECRDNEELYYPDDGTYYDEERFESTSNYGQWTHPEFPVCKEKRCIVPEYAHTDFFTSLNESVAPNEKVEHDTELQKKCHDKFEDVNKTKVICDGGKLQGASACTPKRCSFESDRKMIDTNGVEYLPNKKHEVQHDTILVNKTCRDFQELYDKTNNVYVDGFSSVCNHGQWTTSFPVCVKKRCRIPNYPGTNFVRGNETLEQGEKVESGIHLEVRCDEGYKEEGEREVKCDRSRLKGFTPCSGESCSIPAIKNSKHLEQETVLSHNKEIVLACNDGFDLMRYANEASGEEIQVKCDLGNLTEDTDGLKCEPKRCLIPNHPGTIFVRGNEILQQGMKIETGIHLEVRCDEGYKEEDGRRINCYRGILKRFKPCSEESCTIPAINNSKNHEQQSELPHDEQITVACKTGFYLMKFGEVVSYSGIKTKCNLGSLTEDLDDLTCEMRCKIESSDGTSYRYSNDTQAESGALVHDGTQLKITCENNYTLNYKDSTRVVHEGTVTCINGTLQPGFKCKTNNSDEEEIGAMDEGTGAPPDVGDDYYYYDAYDNDEDVDESEPENRVECSDPENGKSERSYLKYYQVSCNEGYTLNTIEDNRKFLCIGGKLQSEVFKREPECNEDACQFTTDMSRNMEIFEKVKNDKKYYSEGFTFEAGKRLFFNCKDKNMEPVKRAFKCSRGQWVSIQRDFDMTINNTHPECRKVDCGEGCKFGGTCVRDGKCTCPPDTKGANCEKPICDERCYQNNGECIAPSRCRCESLRYGDNCENVGCTLPQTSNTVTIKDERASFRLNDTLRNSDIACPSGFILSTPNDFICKGNETWSEQVKCLEGSKYSIEFKVRDYSIWDLYTGSYCPMLVTMVNEEGTVIGEFDFPAAKYPGRKYSATKPMRYIGKVNRVDITLTPHNGNYDSIKMDYINIIVEDDIRYEVYKLNSVESSRRWNFSPRLETSCARPVIDGRYLEKKVYFSGDTISSSDIECNPGLEPTPTTVTCQQNGQWTGRMACSQRPELVRGLTVTSSSTHKTWGPELAVDGIKTRAPDRCGCCAATNFQYEPWYRVDLGQQYDIHNVSVLGRGGDGDAGHGHNFKNMVISYGINHYTEAQLAHTTDNVYILERSFSDPILARYLELKLIGTTRFFVICELQIYAIRRSSIESNPTPSIPRDNSDAISVTMETYEIEIHSEHSTGSQVNVMIQGDDDSSKALSFTESGFKRGITSKTVGPIRQIQNVMYLTLTLDGWFNRHIVYMKAESSGVEYIGFLDGQEKKQADIPLNTLFQPGCKGNDYTQAKHGFGGDVIDRKNVQSDEECKLLCSGNRNCKTAYVQTERTSIWCKLISSNRPSAFVFRASYTKGNIFYRKC